MEEKFGLISGIECQFVKIDQALNDAISERTGIPIEMVRTYLRYNMFTVNQFSQLTKMAVSTITNKMRPSYRDSVLTTELDYCFPFSDEENEGPKFVIRNSKSEKYLKI